MSRFFIISVSSFFSCLEHVSRTNERLDGDVKSSQNPLAHSPSSLASPLLLNSPVNCLNLHRQEKTGEQKFSDAATKYNVASNVLHEVRSTIYFRAARQHETLPILSVRACARERKSEGEEEKRPMFEDQATSYQNFLEVPTISQILQSSHKSSAETRDEEERQISSLRFAACYQKDLTFKTVT